MGKNLEVFPDLGIRTFMNNNGYLRSVNHIQWHATCTFFRKIKA